MRAKKLFPAAGAAAAGLTAVVVMAGGGAGAQQEVPFQLSDPDPEPGEAFVVTGECFGVGGQPPQQVAGTNVYVFLTDYDPADQIEAFGNHIQQVQQLAPDPLPDPTVFNYAAELVVPEDAEPGDTFFVSAYCLHSFSFNFDDGPFSVGTSEPPPTTPSTNPPTGAPPASTPPGSAGGEAPVVPVEVATEPVDQPEPSSGQPAVTG